MDFFDGYESVRPQYLAVLDWWPIIRADGGMTVLLLLPDGTWRLLELEDVGVEEFD